MTVEQTFCRHFSKRFLRILTHCYTLQHTATHCNTLQHTATHWNTLLVFRPTIENDCRADLWDLSEDKFSEISHFIAWYVHIYVSTRFSFYCRKWLYGTLWRHFSQKFLNNFSFQKFLIFVYTHVIVQSQLVFWSAGESDCRADCWEFLEKNSQKYLTLEHDMCIYVWVLVFRFTVESDCMADFGDISQRDSSTISSFEKFLIFIYTQVILQSQLVVWSTVESDCRADFGDISPRDSSTISSLQKFLIFIDTEVIL